MNERVKAVTEYYIKYGESLTLAKFDISRTTLDRYKRAFKQEGGNIPDGIEKVVIIADCHLSHARDHHPSYELVKRFISTEKPDKLVIVGDFLDFDYISSYSKEHLKQLEGKRFIKDYEMANAELDYFQEYCDNVVFLQGNHEYRVDAVIKKQPNLDGLINLEEQLRLQERGIEYRRLTDPLYKVGKLHFHHGMYYSEHYAKKTLDSFGSNICVGHTHRSQLATKSVPLTMETHACFGLGCLTDLDPEYTNGKPTSHTNGFGLAYVDIGTGNFNFYSIAIVNNSFLWDGKIYD